MPEAGQTIGDFELEAEIGRGAVGTVWRAHQLSLKRTVAVKFLASTSHRDEAWVERFRTEAAESAKLSHPGILPVHAFGQTDDGQLWFAMELVEGDNLSDYLARKGALEPEEAARLVRDAARALAHAHEQGIIHRDIKPANMMLRKDGRLAVTDFGLAKSLESGAMTTTGLLIGTPYYMSPEAVEGVREKIGAPTDIYGLGATLYELLVGRPPFLAENAVALIRMISDEKPVPPRKHRPEIPATLEAITLQAMAKKPENRFESAAVLADALDAWLGEHAPSTSGAKTQVVLRTPRRRLVPWLIGGVLLLGAVTAILLLALKETGEDLAETKEQLSEAKEDDRFDDLRVLYDDFANVSWTILRSLVAPELDRKATPAYSAQWREAGVARLSIEATPADARVSILALPGRGAYSPWKPSDTEERSVVSPGLYRIHVQAPGHQSAILTVLLRPEAEETVQIALVPTPSGRPASVRFLGLLHPAQQEDGSLYGPLRRGLGPFDMATMPVTAGDYSAFLERLSGDERRRFAPKGPSNRRGGARQPAGRPARPEFPVLGVPEAAAEAYAKVAEARIPSVQEMLLVQGIAPLGQLIVGQYSMESRKTWSEVVADMEGLTEIRSHTNWARTASGPLKPTSMRGILLTMMDPNKRPRNSTERFSRPGIRLAWDVE